MWLVFITNKRNHSILNYSGSFLCIISYKVKLICACDKGIVAMATFALSNLDEAFKIHIKQILIA